MAKQKQLTLNELYPQVKSLSTSDQKTLKDFIENTLEEKAKAAKEELELINGKQVFSGQ